MTAMAPSAAPHPLPVHPQALEEAMAVKIRDGTLDVGFDGLLYLGRHLPASGRFTLSSGF